MRFSWILWENIHVAIFLPEVGERKGRKLVKSERVTLRPLWLTEELLQRGNQSTEVNMLFEEIGLLC